MTARHLVRTAVRAAVNRHRRTDVPNDLSMEVSAELARDIAKRKAELQTTLTRKVDLGDFSEQQAEIEYDAAPSEPAAWDYPGYPGYFHVTAVKVRGYDIWPAFDAETQRIFENELDEALRYEARNREEV